MSIDPDRPDRDTTLLGTAMLFSDRSTCSRNRVGCVIARDGRILITGYNGAPAGMPHCKHVCTCTTITGPTKQHAAGCGATRPCTIAVHAEANAVAYAARDGVSVNGATAYVTLSPCVPCAQLLISAGIVRVVFDQPYRDRKGYQLLIDAGVAVDRLL